ncbi:ketoacyl-ACP synthase III family protein [Solwaraspora sp. WMMD791]|uniref:ketoacyl-ACP synthase III family protein n=1 Tax=Solwaraspora sp. WMMD791 TaxID=3016086 RepID=UPI00249B9337|nr:ketoacyl-ACP synthase III family protein [Solwaraspora sp. WMMD791]WFE28334.1 ketoacyl-ACP synthase III family protein [Solwaraspora sp. WMMD791]
MRWTNLYVCGTGTWLPKPVAVDDAVRDGRYPAESAQRSAQTHVTVATDEQAPDMAVRAARQAVARSARAAGDIAAVFHAVVLHAGLDVWNAASYLQRHVAARNAFVAEIRSGSNGGLVAVEAAAAYLLAHPEAPAALVTAADRWPEPYFDRWRCDRIVYADGAAAITLSRHDGFAEILAMATHTDAELEGMHRGTEPFGAYGTATAAAINLDDRHRGFLAETAREEIWRRLDLGVRGACEQALAEAGLTGADIDHVVLPHFGLWLTRRQILQPLGVTDLTRTTWDFSRQVGHLGAGDQLAGLNHLTESGVLRPGAHVLLVGAGAGFTWTGAVLRIRNTPAWSGQPV